ncbi:MAG TPA: DUF6228 family protein [Gammaproteobacteria bacterium]|nr:DUF6228 family protein [Gammaproteobacteria bacterium]
MRDNLKIRSNQHGVELELEMLSRGEEENRYLASIRSHMCTGQTEATTYIYGPPTKFFDDLAANWHGWKGEKKWAEIESRLQFTATMDNLGHVILIVLMRELVEPFSVSAPLYFDAGQLEGLAAEIREFFAVQDLV